jgi:hypothetical protein
VVILLVAINEYYVVTISGYFIDGYFIVDYFIMTIDEFLYYKLLL